MSCDYQKRECVVKATKCLTDEAYRDSQARPFIGLREERAKGGKSRHGQKCHEDDVPNGA